MNRSAAATSVLLLVTHIVGSAPAAEPEGTKVATPAFSFADTKYFHRWSKDGQHEFTPAGQEDLEKWSDMVTIWQYRDVKDGDALAKLSNTILEKYKTANSQILRTNSVPKTKDKPAEHFIAAGFTRPNFREIVFARFKMHDGMGAAIIYSHRAYDPNAREQMQIWGAKNLLTPETNLMKWDEFPKLDTLK